MKEGMHHMTHNDAGLSTLEAIDKPRCKIAIFLRSNF